MGKYPPRHELYMVFYYGYKLNHGATHTAQNINRVWGAGTVADRTVRYWFRDFENGKAIPGVTDVRSRKFNEELSYRICEAEEARDQAIADRNLAQQEAKDADTRYLNAVSEVKALQAQLDALKKKRRTPSTMSDTERMAHLEKEKELLRDELAEAKVQIMELEHALERVNDTQRRTEAMHQAAKQEWERQLLLRNEEGEDHRSLSKRVRELKGEVKAERRLRKQALASNKNLEAQLSTLRRENDNLSKEHEEADSQLRRVQLAAKKAQRERAEARAAADEASSKASDAEKRLRVAEGEIVRLKAELSSCQSARIKAEAERSALAEQLSALRQGAVIAQTSEEHHGPLRHIGRRNRQQ